MKNILMVEDDSTIAFAVKYAVEQEGFNLDIAENLENARKIVNSKEYDLILLDVMLPDGNGFELMETLRSFTNIPVIFLTAKDDIQDKYSGFGLGADDYITKPFMPKELIFRLNAVLRRCYKEDSSLIELHDCKIDLANAQVIWKDKILPLTAKEHDILEVLVRNANHIVTIDALCEAVWGDNPFGYGNSLLAHIRRIREKIEITPSKPKSLITVKGLGYKINVESRL